MSSDVIVVDNFYNEPWQLVRIADGTRFDRGGARTHFERSPSFFPRDAIETLERLTKSKVVLDAAWTAPRESAQRHGENFNGTLYRVRDGTPPPMHIHHDSKDWVGVIYLSPDAAPEDGTAFYRHLPTGRSSTTRPVRSDGDDATRVHGRDPARWEEILFVPNRFNRLVLYSGLAYHRALIRHPRRRLCQLFAFNVTNSPAT